MNVIIANKYKEMLSNLNIDIIKSLQGEFEVEDIIDNFQNFFFNKMILDITAIKNYQNIAVIQKLSLGLDMNKVILLLDDSDTVNSASFISQLVSMGIYNFTRNIDAIMYLINNPNSYKDVAQYHMLNGGESIIKDGKGFDDRAGKTNTFISGDFKASGFGSRIIGIKNLTEGAGATTLIYMLKKQLEENYKVLTLEVDKNDFIFFNDSDLLSVSTPELDPIIKNPNANYDVILVDINDSVKEDSLTEMLYLMEPSTIKLNKMIRKDRGILERMADKKLILNQSLLNAKDIKEFEYEARCKVFYNIPPLDDKQNDHQVLDGLLYQLGFDRQEAGKPKVNAKLFGIKKETDDEE